MSAKTTTASILTLGALLVAACSEESPDTLRRGNDDGSSGSSGNTDVSKEGVIAPSGGSVRAPYQVRTSAQIAAAITTCFGDGVTAVNTKMIQSVENPAGFLSARQFADGADVVVGESSIIDGDPSVERIGVRNSSLSLPILAALQDIGNVVGENCLASTNAKCKCATPEDAHAMLTRCLPSIAPSKYAALESEFAAMCSKDQASAIASLLGSTAFGVQ